MFADSGVKLPRGVGTRTPDDVARAVIRGIEKNRAEIDVAPLSLSLRSAAVRRLRRRLDAAHQPAARRATDVAAPLAEGSATSASLGRRPDRLPRERGDQLARAARAGPPARTCSESSIRSSRACGKSRASRSAVAPSGRSPSPAPRDQHRLVERRRSCCAASCVYRGSMPFRSLAVSRRTPAFVSTGRTQPRVISARDAAA